MSFRDDVLAGLSARPRAIPARWFYDHRGSELFERITGLPEYYPLEPRITAAVNGASRWLDAPAVVVNNPISEEAASAPPAATSAVARTVRPRLSMVRDMHASSCPVP